MKLIDSVCCYCNFAYSNSVSGDCLQLEVCVFSFASDWHLSSALSSISQIGCVFLLFAEFSHNSWVWGNNGGLAHECVCWCRHKLTLVVGASVTDHDLRRVLVRHDNRGLWETASVSVGVVSSKRFSCHACMQVHSLLIHIASNGCNLRWSQRVALLHIRLRLSLEAHSDCLSILHKDSTARRDSGILEVSVWFVQLLIVESLLLWDIPEYIGITCTCRSMLSGHVTSVHHASWRSLVLKFLLLLIITS